VAQRGHSQAEHQAESPDITVIGVGLDRYTQLTGEARAMLRDARCIFYSSVNGELPRGFRRPGRKLVRLEDGRYRPRTYRPTMYREMARDVVREATAGPDVAVLQPGSALVLDSITEFVRDLARKEGLTVQVIPGISCIETVLAQVGFTILEGLQVVVAQKLLLRRQKLDPRTAALVLQPGYYDTLWWAGAARSHPDRYSRLEQYLLRFYKPSSRMALVLGPMGDRYPGHVFWLRFRDLPSLYRLISPLHTLFIPPQERPSVDTGFSRSISSYRESLSHFEPDSRGQPRIEGGDYWFLPNPDELPSRLVKQSEILARRWRERGA